VQAWKELHEKYKKTIIETFQRVGLSLNPNGSEDYKIKIKGLNGIKVGDFTHKTLDLETGFGSLTVGDITLVEAAQAKLAMKVAKSKDKDDEDDEDGEDNEDNEGEEDEEDEDEEDEEVFTLGRMNTRSQTRVNRYYTAEEVESLDIDVDNTDEEVDDEPPNYDPSDDEFDDTLKGDQDAADENME
jgi:hypothetical protein